MGQQGEAVEKGGQVQFFAELGLKKPKKRDFFAGLGFKEPQKRVNEPVSGRGVFFVM